MEAKAELLKDDELLKSEEYLAFSEKHKNQNEETLKRL
jgi:ribulose 1,5-bisphosphate carboxylase large subunit-like protein